MKNIVLVFSLCISTATIFAADPDDGFADMPLMQGAWPIVGETPLAQGEYLLREQAKNQIRAKYLEKYAANLGISRVEVSIYTVLSSSGDALLRAFVICYNQENKTVFQGSESVVYN